MDNQNIEKTLQKENKFSDRQERKFITIAMLYMLFINGILYTSTLLPQEGVAKFILAFLATNLIELFIFDPFKYKKTWQKRLNAFAYLIANIFKLAALLFFIQYGNYDLFSRVGQAKYLTGVKDYILALITFPVVSFIFVVLLFFIFLIYFSKKIQYNGVKTRWKVYAASFAVLLIMFAAVQDVRYVEVYSSLIRSAYAEAFKGDNFSQTASQTLDDIAAGKINDNKFLDYLFKSHANKNEFTGIGKDKNLLIIQVESYQGGFVGKSYGGKKITPYTDELIKKSFYFSEYFQLIGVGNTSDAEFVSLHSVYPSKLTTGYEGYKAKGIKGIPKVAHEKGYTTFSMHGNTGTYYDREHGHKRIGFDEVYLGESYEQDEIIGMGLSDESFFRQSVDRIEKIAKKGKFCGFMVTLTCHGPYGMPEKDVKFKVEPKLEGRPIASYLNAVHYSDRTIGQFLEELDKRGILKNTVVAIYGDHHAFTTGDQKTNDELGDFLGVPFDFDEMMQVPLVIYVPGYEKAIEKKNIGSQIDFMPTIMNIMGWNDTATPMFGVDLLDLKMSRNNAVFPQTYMIKGSFITEDAMFEQSRVTDGFDGRFIDRRTRKELHLGEAAEEKHKTANYLSDICYTLYAKDRLEDVVKAYENSDKSKF